MFKSRKISLLLHAKGKCASLSGSLNLYRQKSTIPESLRSTVFTSNIDTSSISASISTPTPTPTPTTTALSTADFRTKHDISISGDLNDNLFEPLVDFSSTPFFEPLKRALLKEGFTAPTPIQAQSWPILLSGRDLISVARTGSGKTCGFLLPALQKILTSAKSAPNSRNPKILVLAPTRELSVQINEVASNFSRSLGLRNICLYGGTMRGPQMSSLRAGVDIIVGTPGRVFDLLSEGCFRVKDIQYVVFDEADRMLDMGFEPQIRQIVDMLPPGRQTVMFTATWPNEVKQLANEFLEKPVKVQVGETDKLNANKNITQNVVIVNPIDKTQKLLEILKAMMEEKKLTKVPKIIIFRNRKVDCEHLASELNAEGIRSDCLHGDKSQGQRDRVMESFKKGYCRVLIATDVAARGLDVKDVEVVVNYEIPGSCEDYVHRIGRTARGEKTGSSYMFVSQSDINTTSWKQYIDLFARAGQEFPPELMKRIPASGSRSSSGSRSTSNSGQSSFRGSSYQRDNGTNSSGYGNRGRDRGSESSGRSSYTRRDSHSRDSYSKNSRSRFNNDE